MCKIAAELAREDMKIHPNGGILVVANDKTHADVLVTAMTGLGIRTGLFEHLTNPAYNCIVVTKHQDRGELFVC